MTSPRFKLSAYLSAAMLFTSCGHRQSISTGKSAAESSRVCIQTFNAYGPAYSRNIPGRTKAVGEALKATPCEIIQFQEIWTEDHHNLEITAVSQSILTLSATRFDDTERPYIGKSGLSIFTSEVLTEQSFEEFTVNRDGILDDIRESLGVIKGMGTSRITIRDDDTNGIQMINLHTHPDSVRVRITQVTQLLKRFERMLPLTAPLVVTGDFNFEPQSVEYKLLKSFTLLTDSYESDHGGYHDGDCTYCAENPIHWFGESRVIDYILVRSSATRRIEPDGTLINLRGNDTITPSDHYGLRSYVTLAGQEHQRVTPEVFKARREAAIQAIDATLTTLQDNDAIDGDYSSTVTTLNSFRRRLTAAASDDPVLEQMSIP